MFEQGHGHVPGSAANVENSRFRVGKHGRASAAAVSGNVPSVSSFGVDGHGKLYAVSVNGGTLYKLH